MVLERYEVDPKYFIEKYNIPILGERKTAQVVALPGKDGKNGKENKENQKLARPFFD